MNARTRNACGQSAWWKLPQGIISILSDLDVLVVLRLANGRLERPKNRGLWRQTAGCNAGTTNACGQSAWWKLPRGILSILSVLGVLGVSRLANGRLERPNNRGLWRQTAGCNAGTTKLEQQRAMEANGRLQRWNNKCLWPACSVEAGARDFKHFERFKRFSGFRGLNAGKVQA